MKIRTALSLVVGFLAFSFLAGCHFSENKLFKQAEDEVILGQQAEATDYAQALDHYQKAQSLLTELVNKYPRSKLVKEINSGTQKIGGYSFIEFQNKIIPSLITLNKISSSKFELISFLLRKGTKLGGGGRGAAQTMIGSFVDNAYDDSEMFCNLMIVRGRFPGSSLAGAIIDSYNEFFVEDVPPNVNKKLIADCIEYLSKKDLFQGDYYQLQNMASIYAETGGRENWVFDHLVKLAEERSEEKGEKSAIVSIAIIWYKTTQDKAAQKLLLDNLDAINQVGSEESMSNIFAQYQDYKPASKDKSDPILKKLLETSKMMSIPKERINSSISVSCAYVNSGWISGGEKLLINTLSQIEKAEDDIEKSQFIEAIAECYGGAGGQNPRIYQKMIEATDSIKDPDQKISAMGTIAIQCSLLEYCDPSIPGMILKKTEEIIDNSKYKNALCLKAVQAYDTRSMFEQVAMIIKIYCNDNGKLEAIEHLTPDCWCAGTDIIRSKSLYQFFAILDSLKDSEKKTELFRRLSGFYNEMGGKDQKILAITKKMGISLKTEDLNQYLNLAREKASNPKEAMKIAESMPYAADHNFIIANLALNQELKGDLKNAEYYFDIVKQTLTIPELVEQLLNAQKDDFFIKKLMVIIKSADFSGNKDDAIIALAEYYSFLGFADKNLLNDIVNLSGSISDPNKISKFNVRLAAAYAKDKSWGKAIDACLKIRDDESKSWGLENIVEKYVREKENDKNIFVALMNAANTIKIKDDKYQALAWICLGLSVSKIPVDHDIQKALYQIILADPDLRKSAK